MNIKISREKQGVVGLCGHVGVGHTHSHSGFVQDDSAGMAVVASILKKALPIDSTIAGVEVDLLESVIKVTTKDGGIGSAWVRRGITPFESQMINNIIGMDTIYSQEIVLNTFGRIYGQGAMEIAVALQGALSLALIESFVVKWPSEVRLVQEDISSNYGKILASVIDINGVPTSILLTINASQGGIGPIEDLEGNIMLGKKGELIRELGLDKIPTIMVESKSYVPGKSDTLEEDSLLIRANQEYDNTTVAKSLIDAAKELNIRYDYDFKTLVRGKDDFSIASRELGEKIVGYGESFIGARRSEEKVKVIGDLAVLISQDAAGLTFMSDKLQKDVGSAGMLKGTSAVISLLVTEDYIKHYRIPFVTDLDIEKYTQTIYKAILNLKDSLHDAKLELENKFDFKEEDYKSLYNNRI